MATFTAAFDAAGDGRQHPRVIVSGFLANFQQWGWFEHMWKEAHIQAGVDLPFHTTAFNAACTNPQYASQKNARADYVRIAKDQQAASLFLRHLYATITTTVYCGISCLVDMGLYREVDSLLDLSEKIPPYALGARVCIEKLQQWQKYFDIGESAEYIFESGDFEQGKFTDLMIEEGQEVPIYKSKNDYAGLQAADLYAWEQFNAVTKGDSPNYVPRKSASWLIWGIPKLHVRPDLATLIRLCEKKGIKVRI